MQSTGFREDWVVLEGKENSGVTWEDESYPRGLKEADQSPPFLYIRGELEPEDEWTAVVVGTREMTVYGRQIAEDQAGYLVANGITKAANVNKCNYQFPLIKWNPN
jgi:predicted Rossmann fold nucleotide-binding protein DprA/Smf involved in DNA uptake